ncbi:phosphoribosylglycinamide formyltransferase 2, partial [Striga asiatica]
MTKMSRISLPIKKINDKTKNWTTLIQVVERTHVNKRKNNSSVLYRRFLFTDEELPITTSLINSRRRSSRAIVRLEKPEFKVGDYDYNWLLVNGTYAEDFMESIPPQFPCHIGLHRFKDLHKFADTENLKSNGRLDFVVGNRALWYTACNKCHETYNVPLDTAIKCRSCQKEAYIEARCRIPIRINDGTGIVNAIAYGEDTEKLIPFNGIQMYTAEQQGKDLIPEIAQAIKGQHITCYIKHYETEYSSQTRAMHKVVKLYTKQELMKPHATVTEQSNTQRTPETSSSK